MPWIPSRVRASRTSSSLKGLMTAITSFMASPLDGFTQLLAAPANSWQFLAVLGRSWQFLDCASSTLLDVGSGFHRYARENPPHGASGRRHVSKLPGGSLKIKRVSCHTHRQHAAFSGKVCQVF